ncbi:TetR/AcrR family transcriptional regulator [Tessaracoccus terricola]
MAGLRQQWRRDAMRVIQDKALDLFDERGFAAVTIEEIAAAAEVSASSIYRYFGTKERLLAADEFETMSAERLAEILDPADPVGSLVAAVERYESPGDGAADAGAAARRIRYFFTEPSVRAAALATLDRAAERIAPTFAEHGMTAAQARVAANALTFGYFAALETWHTDGGVRPIAHYVEEGLRPLRGIWAQGRFKRR